MALIEKRFQARKAPGARAKLFFAAPILYVLLAFHAVITPSLANAEEIFVDHTLTFALTPDLPGLLEVRPGDDKVTAVRGLLVIDGKLHRIHLQRGENGSFKGAFPSPWKRLEYRIQLATEDRGVLLSANLTAEQSCRNSAKLAAQSHGKLKPGREALLKEAILLDDDIRRLNYVATVIDGLKSKQPSSGQGGE